MPERDGKRRDEVTQRVSEKITTVRQLEQLKPGQVVEIPDIFGTITINRFLGGAAYSRVWLAHWSHTNSLVALKMKSQAALSGNGEADVYRAFQEEISVLTGLNDAEKQLNDGVNVSPQYHYGSVRKEGANKLNVLVMEYVPYPELRTRQPVRDGWNYVRARQALAKAARNVQDHFRLWSQLTGEDRAMSLQEEVAALASDRSDEQIAAQVSEQEHRESSQHLQHPLVAVTDACRLIQLLHLQGHAYRDAQLGNNIRYDPQTRATKLLDFNLVDFRKVAIEQDIGMHFVQRDIRSIAWHVFYLMTGQKLLSIPTDDSGKPFDIQQILRLGRAEWLVGTPVAVRKIVERALCSTDEQYTSAMNFDEVSQERPEPQRLADFSSLGGALRYV